MDDWLKTRLLGAAVLLALVLLLSLLLPEPGDQHAGAPAGGAKEVTLDLRAPATADTAAPVSPTPVPPVIAAPAAPQVPADAPNLVPEQSGDDTPPTDDGHPPAPASTADTALASLPAPATVPASPPTPKADLALKSPAPSHAQQVAAPPKPAAAGKWYVQVGAFADIDHARQALEKLRNAGIAGIISPTDTHNGTRYRVRAGPYAGEAQARAAQPALARAGFAQSDLTGG